MSKKDKNKEVKEPQVEDTATATAEQEQKEEKTAEEQLQDQLVAEKDKFMRLFAEFENYKKRTMKEKLELMKTAAQDTLNAILPILDDFDRAKSSADDDSTNEVFTDGVKLVYDKLNSTLAARGLKAMKSNGEVFDPELHEAITEIPAPNDEMKGKIIDTIQKGYYLQDKIIRHAKVVVGK